MSDTSSLAFPRLRISIFMFLQFFMWGAWFATLGQVLGSNGLGQFGADSYGAAPLGAMIAPLFLGLIADRFFSSQKVLGVLFLIAGGALFFAWLAAEKEAGTTMVWMLRLHMFAFMPTLALGNTVAFSHLDAVAFPKARVWGTIGWVISGFVVGSLAWSSELKVMPLAGATAIILGIFSFFLPKTPPPAAGQEVKLSSLLMFDAWALFKKPAFAVFMLSSAALCIPLAYYFAQTSNYLSNLGFHQPSVTMALGQVSEIFFMLLIPFFFRRLGVKGMVLIAMGCWVLRYLLFSFGAPDQTIAMVFVGILLHGICYDFFFVTGFMYAEKSVPEKVRGQAQSLLVFMTQGLGMYFGYKVAYGKVANVSGYAPLNEAVLAAGDERKLSFWEQQAQMFRVGIPEGIDESLISTAMGQWKDYWFFPAILAGGVAIIFAVAFWDKAADESKKSK